MARGDHDDPRLYKLNAMVEFRRSEPRTRAGQDGAEAGGGQRQLDVLDAVLGQDDDPVAPDHAERRQRMRGAIHPRIERGVGQARLPVVEGNGCGREARPRAKETADGAAGRATNQRD